MRTVIEPDPLTRGVVAECYERFAAGESGQAIAAWLASLPTELRGGRSWPVNCVTGPRGLLRSPTYAARPAAGVDDVLERPVANWEALVSDDVWVSVQARLEQSGAAFQRAASRTYLLSGYVRCPVCGLRMVATSCQRGDRPGERRYQYRCSGWARGANAPVVKCMASSPMAQADTAVLDVVSGLLDTLATPTGWPAFLAQWTALNAPATLDSARISELEREVAKLNKQLANAAGLLSDGVLDADGYNALRDQSTTRIKAAQSELERLNQTAQSARTTRQPNAQAIFELAGGWARVLREVGNVTAKRAVLDRLVKSVVIGKVGWRQYAATIEWQPLGTRLAAVVGQLAA
ncbi:MAG TPA: recombinase zinc beta ribbon domain-containing protein [Chloroflexota bacterium]|nr:recombinase zinc beta ribbon domain-containing protein [Chloroflexota bacterium]